MLDYMMFPTIRDNMRTKVRVMVVAEHVVEHEPEEDITKRFADIYLHGEGENGHKFGEYIGGDSTITILEVMK